ncbi:hypothetical protein NTE28_004928 [Vibrio harveyi]|nr:hypothetical protein [Vibrio harveyi]
MDKFSEILRLATSKVEAEYFKLIQYDADDVYRERVYCYELYHQMRCVWDYEEFILNGEVDKAGHPALKNTDVANAKPDFLVHYPGDMRKNDTVIEVKSSNAGIGAIATDLTNLAEFKLNVGYCRAIFLVYGSGYSNEHWVDKVNRAAEQVSKSTTVELWRHKTCLEPAEFLGDVPVGRRI